MNPENSLGNSFTFLQKTYEGYRTLRWSGNPFLERAQNEGNTESIIEHTYSVLLLWNMLRNLYPSLNKCVDSDKLTEIILFHDLGEIEAGDFALYSRVSGEIHDKEAEKLALTTLTADLPNHDKIKGYFDQYEKEIDEVDDIEILFARWLDNIQGNHFALVYGQNLPDFSEPINKILRVRFIPYTNRILEVLSERGQDVAVTSVKEIAQFHSNAIKEAGIEFDDSKLNL